MVTYCTMYTTKYDYNRCSGHVLLHMTLLRLFYFNVPTQKRLIYLFIFNHCRNIGINNNITVPDMQIKTPVYL